MDRLEDAPASRRASVDSGPMTPHEIQLSKRFFRATEWAASRHEDDAREGRPSLGQVLGIASLVLEDGGTEREAIAAMALDALGDDDVAFDELREQFGKKVARLVVRCRDGREAGVATRVERLEREDDESVRRVLASDTVRELRALVVSVRHSGSVAFARFEVSPAAQMDHYQAILQVFTRHDPRGTLTEEVRHALGELRRIAELDAATAAWQVAHTDAA